MIEIKNDSPLDSGDIFSIASLIDRVFDIQDIFGIGKIDFIYDVDTSNSLANNHSLVYDSASYKWVNKSPSDTVLSLGITALASELNYNDLTLLGTAEASKVLTSDVNGLTIFPDTFKLSVGTGEDLQIHHDGTNSLINNTTGQLRISAEAGSSSDILIGNSSSTVLVGQHLTVTGNLTVNGQTTTVNSTVTTVDDPIITLGGDTAPSSNDSKDRGVEFRWHNGTSDKVGFFGFDDSSAKFTFIPDAANASEVFSGSAGDVAFGAGEFSDHLVLNNAKSLRLSELSSNGTNHISIKAPDSVTSDVTLVLPDGTGTNGQALVTDGNGNLSWSSTASTGLSSSDITGQTEESSIADDDLILISDTSSSGALRKMTKANFVSGLGGLSNVVEDTTPQLGGNLDVNGHGLGAYSGSTGHIVLTTSPGIDNAAVQIVNQGRSSKLELWENTSYYVGLKTSSSLGASYDLTLPTSDGSANQVLKTDGSGNLSWTNNAGGISDIVVDTTPQLGGSLDVNGQDIVSVSNGNITLTPDGSGVVRVDGTSGIDLQSGEISVKNSGSVSNIKLYCEVGNAHYTQLQSAAHTSYSGNVTLTLPTSTGTLVGTGDTGTVTNTMLAGSIANGKLANSAVTVTAGNGLAGGGSVSLGGTTNLTLNLNELTPAVVDVANDHIVIVDANDANASKKESVADLVAGVAGTGLSASSGQLSIAATSVENSMLAGSIEASKMNNPIFADLETLGAPTADGEFIVATGAGAFAYESGETARTSLGLGTGDSPTFTSLTLSGQTSDLAMNSQKITGLATPTADGDAATKSYVDGVAQGLSAKDSVRVATTGNETLSTAFANGEEIDGVTLATGDRILIKDQTSGAENGIYTVNASGAPTRALDFDENSEVEKGAFIFVEEGTTNADAGFVLTTDGAITLGTTALSFTQFSGAGDITAGDALTKSGNTLNVAVDNSSIEINSDSLRVKAAGITSAMLAGSIANSKLNQLTTANKVALSSLDLDGGTDIGADLVDADLIVVDDGAAGTNRKSALSRIKKYIFSSVSGDATASDVGALSLASSSITGQTAETSIADDDLILISDTSASGALRKMTKANFVSGLSGATAADDISTGDAAVTIATSAGNITLDAQGDNTDIIFKGTDGGSDTTFLTLDGSDAGTAIFNHDIKLQSDGAKIYFGADSDVHLFHYHDTGLVLDMGAEGINEPEFTIRSQGNTVGPELKLQSTTNTVGATIATINFDAADTLNNQKAFASIIARIDNATYGGSEAGTLYITGQGGTGSNNFAGFSGAGLELYQDLSIVHDGTVIKLGANSEIQLAHVHNEGLTLKHTATGDNSTVKFTLQTGETDIQANDVIGAINFQAPDEGTGTDAILVCAGIEAVSEGDFSSSNNATKLSFKTGSSEAAAEKMSLSSTGNLTVTGDLILDDGGSIKEAGGTAAITIDADGHVTKIGQDSPSNGQFLKWDGSKAVWDAASGGGTDLTSIGSNVLPSTANTYSLGSAAAEWSDLYLGDSSRVYFGNDQDVFLEHNADAGLTLDMGVAENTYEPMFKLVSQGTSTTIGPSLNFFFDKTAPSSTDRLGQIIFSGDDSSGNLHYYGLIGCKPSNATNGSETGKIFLSPSPASGNNPALHGLTIEGVTGDNTKATVNVTNHNGSDSGLQLNGTLLTSTAAELNALDVSSESPSDNDVLTYTAGNGLHWAAASGGGSATIPDVQVLTTSTPVNAVFASSGSNGDNERVYLVNNGSTAVQINLPAVSGNTGKKFQIKRLGTANVTIAVQSGESLEATTNGTFVLTSQYSSVTVVCNASGTINGWYII